MASIQSKHSPLWPLCENNFSIFSFIFLHGAVIAATAGLATLHKVPKTCRNCSFFAKVKALLPLDWIGAPIFQIFQVILLHDIVCALFICVWLCFSLWVCQPPISLLMMSLHESRLDCLVLGLAKHVGERLIMPDSNQCPHILRSFFCSSFLIYFISHCWYVCNVRLRILWVTVFSWWLLSTAISLEGLWNTIEDEMFAFVVFFSVPLRLKFDEIHPTQTSVCVSFLQRAAVICCSKQEAFIWTTFTSS